MDQSKLQKFHNCIKHSKKKIKFIQVNQVSNNPTSNLFYCTDCINDDLDFKGINYLLVDQIIQQGESNILPKWPPVNDFQLIEQLIRQTSKFDQSQYVIQRITNYFTELKDQILRKIEFCQKQMINHALDLPFGKDQIIKQYQQISQISQLQSLIFESKNNNSLEESFSQKFRAFISEIELKKDENTQKLQQLLNQSIQQQQLINYEYPNQIKEQIFSFIDQIDFFNKDILSKNSDSNQSQNSQKISDRLLQLISNKSNYCSNEFLSKIKQQLEKVNCLFEILNTQNIHIEGKEPIKFDLLSEQKINQIKEYVEHQIELKNNQNYLQSIQQSPIIQDISKILESKLNFVNIESQQIIKQHFVDTYTFLQSERNIEITQQQESFNLLNSMQEEMVKNLLLLIKEKQLFTNGQKISETQKMKEIKFFKKYLKNSLENIFSQFPIFDIIPINQINILNDIQLLKSSFNEGDQRISIFKNKQNYYEVGINQVQYQGHYKDSITNCISNIDLQKDKKYIFRLQLKSYLANYYYLGLMQNENLHTQEGHLDDLYAEFNTQNNKFVLSNDSCLNKYLKGGDMQITVEDQIELRIWLNGEIFQMVDYPQQNFKVGLKDENLKYLKTMDNLKLFVQLCDSNRTYVITDALIVEEFDD
ncbi:hypothetical protein ABPG74_007906 [Tetrahymena malaccensis]